MKGYRTYTALCFAFFASVLPDIQVGSAEINDALVALCLGLAAYYRSKA